MNQVRSNTTNTSYSHEDILIFAPSAMCHGPQNIASMSSRSTWLRVDFHSTLAVCVVAPQYPCIVVSGTNKGNSAPQNLKNLHEARQSVRLDPPRFNQPKHRALIAQHLTELGKSTLPISQSIVHCQVALVGPYRGVVVNRE